MTSTTKVKEELKTVLKDLQWVELLVYMDAILSMSKSFDKGIERLAGIFVR